MIGWFLGSHAADERNVAWSLSDHVVWPNAVNSGLTFCDSTVVGAPDSARTASTFFAAAVGSPRPCQIDSAASLSDCVIAARIASVAAGGSVSRRPAIASGTLIVDHAVPVLQSPAVTGSGPAPTSPDDDARFRIDFGGE